MAKTDLQTKLEAVVAEIGKDMKSVNADLTTASTERQSLQTQVTNAQTAISNNTTEITAVKNDVKTLQDAKIDVDSLMGDIRANLINDTTTGTTTVYSSSKVADLIQGAKDDLLNGAGEAYDTLKELGDLIDSNKTTIEALETVASNHVSFASAQSLTEKQKTQARDNIGGASASEVTTISGKVTTLETTIGTKLPRTGDRGALAGYELTATIADEALAIDMNSNDNIYASGATTVTVSDGTTGTAWTKTISFATAPTITLGSAWKWVGGSAPTTASGTILVLHWNNFVGYANLLTI